MAYPYICIDELIFVEVEIFRLTKLSVLIIAIIVSVMKTSAHGRRFEVLISSVELYTHYIPSAR